jgi:hypothetical protein
MNIGFSPIKKRKGRPAPFIPGGQCIGELGYAAKQHAQCEPSRIVVDVVELR